MIARPYCLFAALGMFWGIAKLPAGETVPAVPRPYSGVTSAGWQPTVIPGDYHWHHRHSGYQPGSSDWRYWADKRWNAAAPATGAARFGDVHTNYLDSEFSRRPSIDGNAARSHFGSPSQRTTGYRSPAPLYDRRYAHTPYYDRDLGGPYRGHGFGYPYRDAGYGIGGYYGASNDERGYPTYGYGFGYPGYGSTYRGGYFDTGTVVGAPPASDRMHNSGFGGLFGSDR